MMRLAPIAAAAFCLFSAAPQLAAQQRPLDHTDVLTWNRIADAALSPDGSWVTYALEAMEGDPSIEIRAADREGAGVVRRGQDPVFTADSRFVVFRIPPFESVVDSLKQEGTRESDLPKDSLGVVNLDQAFSGGSPQMAGITALGPIESFQMSEGSAWVGYLVEDVEDESDEPDDERSDDEREETPEAKKKEDGKTLVLRNLANGEETRIQNVSEFVFSENGTLLAYTTSTEDGLEDGAYTIALSTGTRSALHEGPGHYEQIAVSKDANRVAFLTDSEDWDSDRPEHALHVSTNNGASSAVVTTGHRALPASWIVSDNGNVEFSDGGAMLRFGTAPRPQPEPEDDTPEDEQVEVDIWNWKDPYLQPMQLVQLNQERRRTYAAVLHLDGSNEGQVVQLGTPDVPTVRFVDEGDAAHAVGVTDVPYRQLISWDGRYQDIWSIDVATGERHLVAEAVKGFGGGQISPSGRYAYWWDGADKQWKGASLDAGTGNSTIVLSQGAAHPVWNELDDHPDQPPPYGAAGWTEGDRAFVYYDRYDVLRFEPESGETTVVTAGAGRENGMRFRHAARDPEAEHVPEGAVWWQAFDMEDKRSGIFEGRSDRSAAPSEVLMAEKRFAIRGKAENADRWLVTREDFREFPDLHTTGGSFSDLVQVSNANPQQNNFSWGTAELVDWMSNDGERLQGMLFKPDDFDPAKQYPMMVYFYERMSDGLYQYRAPTPGGSSISVPFYVSKGYLVFIPDIPYEIGYPGESALDAVVPGVLSVIDEGFVQRDKIGVQGHSWGGYQIAYMITKTNLFAAAEAGAPVANMTSAYGGIRWQSGMSRMFQYERTQSRIGGTLWEATQEYIHNSPVFFADKIHTPLLMMHNDEDGAVPWYQGIEMFVSMRRLQKPVWMLNYNGEAHGLRQEHNRKDWAIRMQQFFDHYLMDAPAPVWMEEGVPALLKGRTLGTELVAPIGVSQEEG